MLPAEVKCTTGKPLLPCEGMELLRQEAFAFSALRAGSKVLSQKRSFMARDIDKVVSSRSKSLFFRRTVRLHLGSYRWFKLLPHQAGIVTVTPEQLVV